MWTQQIITEVAQELGIEYEALKKWRQRGRVPLKYQLLIVRRVIETLEADQEART